MEDKVDARIAELAPILVRVAFTLDHAKAALDMVNAKVPPNGPKNQQFKDSAIWQAVLTLSTDYTVHLISNDRAFLRDRNDPKKGLALNLEADCQRVRGNVAVYCDLGSCLKAISSDTPSVDEGQLDSLIMDSITPQLRAEAVRQKCRIGDRVNIEIRAFQTDQHDRVAVDYRVTMRCAEDPSVRTDGRIDFRAIVHGSCYFGRTADFISDNFIQYITFKWNYPSGGHGGAARSFEDEDLSIPFRRPVEPWSENE